MFCFFFFFSSRRRHTRFDCDWSSDVCSSDLDKALSLRLRELGGLIRSAGDIAVTEQAKRIEADHVQRAIKVSRSIEDQIRERYGSYTAGVGTDLSSAQRESSPYHYWNEHKADDVQGYQ